MTGDEDEGADEIAGIGGPSLCKACITLPIHADVPAGGWISEEGSVRLRPDPSTLRPVPWIPGRRAQLALVTMVDELTGQPWSLCPRALLQRVLAGAEAQHGLAFRVGFEIEFVLADAQGHPMGTQPYCALMLISARDRLGGLILIVINGDGQTRKGKAIDDWGDRACSFNPAPPASALLAFGFLGGQPSPVPSRFVFVLFYCCFYCFCSYL